MAIQHHRAVPGQAVLLGPRRHSRGSLSARSDLVTRIDIRALVGDTCAPRVGRQHASEWVLPRRGRGYRCRDGSEVHASRATP